MVAIKKGLMACLLWIVAATAWAGEDPEFINKQQQDEIINLAYTQMRASVEELEKKIDACELLIRNNTLSPVLFQTLSLTKQEARVTLKYFYSLAQHKCEGLELWAKVAIEFARFKYIERLYKGENIIKTENNFEIICCAGSRSRYEEQWQYLKIAPEVREQLERIPELMQPFDLVKTAEKMGLLETIEQR
ncbi:MAG: hypothetical protein L3J88_03450 [Gammaproteobacteria bacterium]|nr:hypothetical protein [Gammaproteobacteria bacterium]MCF6362405.1 hypothetical protein [Gammaproteobacteria bacterium]